MNNFILNFYFKRKTKNYNMKMGIYHCNDCGHEEKPLRVMSILNLLMYLIISVVAGFLLHSYIYAILIGLALTFINVKFVKAQCPKCKSSNVTLCGYLSEEDVKRKKQEKMEALKKRAEEAKAKKQSK